MPIVLASLFKKNYKLQMLVSAVSKPEILTEVTKLNNNCPQYHPYSFKT